MKKGFMLFAVACAIAVAFAADQDEQKKGKPAATVSPPGKFGVSPTPSVQPNTTTTAPNTTTTTHAPNTTTTTHAPNTTTTTHAPNTTTTTHAPNTTTTTHAPNTTTTTHAPNTTTTTHAPNTTTTTHAPNTTTTTHAPNTTTTTHAPNTTTTVHTTTANHTVGPNTTTATPPPPQPTPKANVTTGNYTLKDKDGKSCVLIQMGLQIRVQFATKNNKSEGTFIVQPLKTTVTGTCDASKANFNLTFPEGFVALQFQKNATQKAVYVTSVAVEVTYPFDQAVDPTAKYSAKNESLELFRAGIGHSYSCRSQVVNMGQVITLSVTQNRMQAFNITNDNYGLPDPCPADKPDYRVAIAVGIVLLVLICIVVLAYLVGRRRRTDGYQSL
ncbi:macrosialin-like [Megalops cyprinoides]|uniref:macrosialin-like n=1 Tax=Megalops cyprinoides TaxID=118141 RepID=UPI001863B9B9|nr:macrosialin-like [Megalops cyprinoides]